MIRSDMLWYDVIWCNMIWRPRSGPGSDDQIIRGIRWLKTSGKSPRGTRSRPLRTEVLLQPNPLKSRILVRRLAVMMFLQRLGDWLGTVNEARRGGAHGGTCSYLRICMIHDTILISVNWLYVQHVNEQIHDVNIQIHENPDMYILNIIRPSSERIVNRFLKRHAWGAQIRQISFLTEVREWSSASHHHNILCSYRACRGLVRGGLPGCGAGAILPRCLLLRWLLLLLLLLLFTHCYPVVHQGLYLFFRPWLLSFLRSLQLHKQAQQPLIYFCSKGLFVGPWGQTADPVRTTG